MLQAQQAQQPQEHQMPDPVPAAVVALDQASSAALQTSYSSLFHAQLKLQQNGIFVACRREMCVFVRSLMLEQGQSI